jgi:hypothetical protein
MQKVINALAVTSFLVSAAVVAGGAYVYTQKDALIANAKAQVTDAIADMLGGSQLGSTLIGGSAGGVDVTDEALGVDTNPPVPIPSIPF